MRFSRLFLVVPALLLLACSEDPAPPEVVRADSTGAGGSSAAGGTSTAGGQAGAATAGSGGSGVAGAGASQSEGGSAGTGTAGKGGSEIDTGGKGTETAYPAGPFGLEVGDIVQNFFFDGLRNPAAASYSTATTEKIAFSDYYNPTEDPAKTHVLVVTASARWCTFCKAEAKGSMGHYNFWKEKGVVFITTLFDNETPGSPAGYKDLEIWTKAYKLEYPVVLDPNPPQLGVFFKLDAAPFNMVIDTNTMKILFKAEGQVEFTQDNAVLKKATGG
jgi:hypothetical protein